MRMKLKLLRTQKNLSQEKMAQKIGCTRASYQAIEKGKRQGGKTFWLNFQRAFMVPDVEMWSYQKNEE